MIKCFGRIDSLFFTLTFPGIPETFSIELLELQTP